MKNKWLLWGAVAVGAYLIYKKMSKGTTEGGRELAPPPVSKPPVSKPPINTSPSVDNTKSFVCPTKEQMARTRYTAEGLEQLRAMGCI
jgi:hypothetical protein